MEYVVRVQSRDSSNLTHGLARVTVTDVVGTTANQPAATAAVLESVTTEPVADACAAVSATEVSCAFGSLASGSAFTATLVFRTADAAVSGTRLRADISFDAQTTSESGAADPNRARRSAENTTAYEDSPNRAATFVPSDETFDVNLQTTLSSLRFTAPGTQSFVARIRDVADDAAHCFASYACGLQVTNTEVADLFDPDSPLQWTRRIVNPPKGVSASNIVAIHFFDPVGATVDPVTDTVTAAKSFLGIDGVRFSAVAGGELPAPLVAGVDYFVLDARDGTFRVGTAKKGKPIDLSTSGSGVTVERIRVIGDTKAERWTSCMRPPSSRVPSIFASKVDSSTIHTCIWDSENGWMK
jgi:hypothetical protein